MKNQSAWIVAAILLCLLGFTTLQKSVLLGLLFIIAGLLLLLYILRLKNASNNSANAGDTASKSSGNIEKAASDYNKPIYQEEIKEFKVVGVSFNNKDNSSRQSILRHAYYNDHPYEDYEAIIREYEYEGAPAYGVYLAYTDDEYITRAKQIGNIAAKDVNYIVENRFSFDGVERIEIYSGGNASWGAHIYLRFIFSGGAASGELDHYDVVFDDD